MEEGEESRAHYEREKEVRVQEWNLKFEEVIDMLVQNYSKAV